MWCLRMEHFGSKLIQLRTHVILLRAYYMMSGGSGGPSYQLRLVYIRPLGHQVLDDVRVTVLSSEVQRSRAALRRYVR